MADLKFIPNGADTEMALEDIPDEVRNDVEETYALLKRQPGRVSVSFPSEGELNKYVNLVKAYCKVRPGGEVRFRKSPTRNLAKTTMEFRITDLKTEDEEVTEGISTSVDNVKAAAKK